VINVQELLNKVPPEEGGPLVKLKVDGLAWDKTISAIRKFQKEYLLHKWPDSRVDHHGKTLDALNSFETVPKTWYSYTVPGFKPLIGQPLNSHVCWAASYTMLRSWRDGKEYAIEEAVAKVDQKYVQRYKKDQGLAPAESWTFMTKAGLQSHKFQCYPIETWLKYLQEHGLLLVGAQAAETSLTTLHMRVVEGIYGFAGEPDGTWTQIMDPGWGGKKYN
jgi:hypothetical protein